jgi:hypothetical protein
MALSGCADKAALQLLGTGALGADARAAAFSGAQDPLARWLFRSSIRAATSPGAVSPVRLENPLLETLADGP